MKTQASSVEITTFTMQDIEGVVALWKTAFPASDGIKEPRSIALQKFNFQPELFFIAKKDGIVIGVVLAGYDGYRGYIYRLAVSPEYRRKSIATQLIERALSELKALGCPRVKLQLERYDSMLVELYQRHGFAVEPFIGMGKTFES
ncbi:MAG TPA: GNAT family N-acetyltransferase [Rickettsiales bacterium]|nr:GNAT family N-acetyltransferase [Rickettsiales bacterium]